MTPNEIRILKKSWLSISENSLEIARSFYDTLFELDPSLKKLFSENFVVEKIMESLGNTIDLLDEPEELNRQLKALAVRHLKYGVKEDDYATVGVALISAIGTVLKDDFDNENERTWESLYAMIAQVMIEETYRTQTEITENEDANSGEKTMSDHSESQNDVTAQLQSAIDQSGTAVIMINRDFEITYINESSLKLLGGHEQTFQKRWPSFKADKDLMMGFCIDSFHKNPEHQRQMLSKPENLPLKTNIEIEDVIIELNVAALKDGAGNYIGNSLEWRDVTEEAQMRLVNADYEGKLNAISKAQAVIEFEVDGTIISANDNFLNTMGYSLDEIKGQHHSMFAEPAYKESVEYRLFWEKLGRGEFEAGEYKRLGKGGKEIWIQASYNPIIDPDTGKPFKVVKYATDVTKQKLHNADYIGQIEAIGKSQAVIEFDMNGIIQTANENFLNTVGYQLEELKGQHHSMFVEQDYKNSVEYRQFWEQLGRGEFDAGEYKRIGKNGKEIWIQASYNPIFDLNGRAFKVVKYATDITERKQAIESIKENLMAMSKGDLTNKIDGNLGDEFNVLRDSMNSLSDNLNNMVSEIRNTAGSVFSAAREIAQGNTDLSQRTESQASSLEETASAMEELNTTVQQNAENATKASQLSNQAMEKAGAGGEVVHSAISAMEEINKSSKQIADIIGVIDEIAFQTNLLALNAAVEAARAGEQGRGFAVVAAEVRNLAQRSAGAAKEIKSLINDSGDAVSKGTKLVDETGQTFSELVNAVQEVVTMISDIDSASKEQAAGINEVSQAVAQMDEMTQQNAALVEEASASSKSMEEQSQELLESMKFFQTGEDLEPIVSPVNRQRQVQRPAMAAASAAAVDDDWQEF